MPALSLIGNLPFGVKIQREGIGIVLAGTPTRSGESHLTVTVNDGVAKRTTDVTLIVVEPELAHLATGVIALTLFGPDTCGVTWPRSRTRCFA